MIHFISAIKIHLIIIDICSTGITLILPNVSDNKIDVVHLVFFKSVSNDREPGQLAKVEGRRSMDQNGVRRWIRQSSKLLIPKSRS